MSLVVEQKELAAVLGKVSLAVGDEKLNALSATIRIEGDGGSLRLRSTNLSVEIEGAGPADGELDPVCVRADRLTGICKALAGRSDIEMSLHGGALLLVSGSASFELPTNSSENFPQLARGEEVCSLAIEGSNLSRCIMHAVSCAATDDTRRYLSGVSVERGSIANADDAAHLTFFGGNGKKFAVREAQVNGNSASWPAIILHRDSCKLLAKLVASAGPVTLRALSAGSNRIEIAFGGYRALFLLVDATPAPWRESFSRHGSPPGGFLHKTADLARVVNTISAAVDQKGDAVVRFEASAGETSIQRNGAHARASDQCKHEVSGSPETTSILFSASNLADLLANWDADDILLSPRENESAPTIITSPADPTLLGATMRLRGRA